MFFYNLGISLYAFTVRLASLFNKKASKMVTGHKEVFTILQEKVDPSADYVWFHAASLGEFEQGRPIMEALKKDYPHYKILLTFFSPSGYEVRNDYPLADIVCYLPFDKKKKVKKFLSLAQPKIAIFIKYEFWCNYINQLHQQKIPTYMVSSIFRSNQVFFKWYGGTMRKLLTKYECICVQDDESKDLLRTIQVTNTKVCGDTRFDRVVDIQKQAKDIDVIDIFAQKAKSEEERILIAGSSWPKDEDIFINYFNKNTDLKLIVAPHEIDEAHLKYIESTLLRPHIRLSEASPANIENYDCIIIDCFGLLSSIYRYGDIAYVGGGFGVGIHNVLEAAVFGIPVIFGPNFKKFREAKQLLELGGGYSINDDVSFRLMMDEFLQYEETLSTAGKHAKEYVEGNTGVVKKVMDTIFVK